MNVYGRALTDCPLCGTRHTATDEGESFLCGSCDSEWLVRDNQRLTRSDMLNFRPMQAATFKEAKHASYIGDARHIEEEKLNGDRVLDAVWSRGSQFFTRTLSRADDLPVEKTGWLPHLKHIALSEFQLLDGEIITAGISDHTTVAERFGCLQPKSIRRQTKLGWLIYAVFDILVYDGVDVRTEPLAVRRDMRDDVLDRIWSQINRANRSRGGLHRPNTYVRRVNEGSGPEFIERIWSRGGEGTIVKDLGSTYQSDKRPVNAWLKRKTEIEVDLVIIGYKDAKETSTKSDGTTSATKFAGQVGSILLGAYDGSKLVSITHSSGISNDLRRHVTAKKREYIGRVVRVRAQKVMVNKSGELSLQNPRIVDKDARTDKRGSECTVDDVRELIA